MVPLCFYFENDGTVFLVLEHARGGRLWDHVSTFIHSHPSTPVHIAGHENVYLGKKLIEDAPPLLDFALFDDSYTALIEEYRSGILCQQSSSNDTDSHSENPCKVDMECITISTEVESKEEKSVSEADTSESCINLHCVPENTPSGADTTPVSFHVFVENGDINSLLLGNDISDISSETVEHLNTFDLMKNAQTLLKSINETLMISEADDKRATENLEAIRVSKKERNYTNTSYTNFFLPVQSFEGYAQISTKSPTGCSPRHRLLSAGRPLALERCFSSDDLFVGHSRSTSNMLSKPHPHLPENCIREWAAELVVCLGKLHEYGLIYKDLRPDNVLLDEKNHLLLSYICNWPSVDTSVNADSIKYLYAAPEVTSIFQPTPAADWWSLGALLFELITGKPLYISQPGGIHSHSILVFPEFVSSEARSLLTELLRYHPHERLGYGAEGIEDIKSHPFFSGIDWEAHERRKLPL